MVVDEAEHLENSSEEVEEGQGAGRRKVDIAVGGCSGAVGELLRSCCGRWHRRILEGSALVCLV